MAATKKRDNNWIPTEAVRALDEIRDRYKGQLTEDAISKILYKLNQIWRDIMRKEHDAIRKRLTTQIGDLKRQVVTKQAYDKGELMSEISRTKKELAFANKQLHNSRATNFGDEKAMEARHQDEIERSIKVVETVSIQKKMLEDENEELKSRISELMAERDHIHMDTRNRLE